MSEVVRVRVVIRGRVQGVWFRASTQETARRLGLSGWVRNRYDGTVEAAFEGPEPAVEQAVAWCRTGPDRAVVEHVEVCRESPDGLEGFRVTG